MRDKQCNDCKQTKSLDLFDKRIDRDNRPMSYCRECRKKRQNTFNAVPEHQEKNKARMHQFYVDNKEELLVKNKQWRDNVRNLWGVSYNTLRKRTDIQHKLRQNIRKRLYGCLILGTRTPDLLGCSVEELKLHLESLFKSDMNWSNYGSRGIWEIDHIIPLKAYDLSDIEQIKKASYYTNLQPLYISENRKKHAKIKH